MPISRSKKEELVARYVELLKSSNGVVISRNDGMTMPQFDLVRAKLREIDSTFMVIKNTLLALALKEAEMPVPEELLTGPVVVAFANTDLAATAKALLAFHKDVELFNVSGALADGELYDGAGVRALSELPSLDELRGQLVGLIIAPASGLVNVVNSGVTQVLNVVAAYADKEESEAA